jgi:hypothetical protein
MRPGRTVTGRKFFAFLCLALLLSSLSLRAVAVGPPANKARISLTIGQPSIWSLAQAHYLLAGMREADKGIAPGTLVLNPNDTNGFRFDVLRQVFGAEGGFNGVAGAQNQVEMQRFQQDATRRQTARTRLDEALNQRQVVFTQLARVNRKLATAKVEEDDLNAIPEKQRPDDFQTRLQNVQTQIKDLSGAQAALQAQRDEVDGQITSLEKDTNATFNAPALKGIFGDNSTTGPAGVGSTGATAFPNDMGDVIDKILANPPNAKLNASTMLDNHIQLQYEIIAKQLTLLRDEVGPDQRLVFLELPLSLYTVPGKSDDYLVQIDWNIKSYYGIDPTLPLTIQKRLREYKQQSEKTSSPLTLELIDRLEGPGGPKAMFVEFAKDKTDAEIDALWQIRNLLRALDSLNIDIKANPAQQRLADKQKQEQEDRKQSVNDKTNELDEVLAAYRRLRIDRIGIAGPDDQTIKSLAQSLRDEYEPFIQNPLLAKMKWLDVKTLNKEDDFRTVDIIPRQSALNVNAANASSTGFNLSAAFQWLTGIGAKVSYQRQRQVYEQFVNQEIFASGRGKGVNTFSWTFGPLPGTKQIAPGVKTTYAVLVIPKDAQILTLHARGSSYKKKEAPDDSPVPLEERDFRIVVPNEQTEGFWVNGITYTPVVQGDRVTAVLTAQYFSPQIGILINGVPLNRVVSIGSSTVGAAGSGVQGEYEYLSSNQIVMSFSMGSSYVGTPIITLVTPEKTSAINYFNDLRINFRKDQLSLNEASKKDPMFLHRLELSEVQVKHSDNDGGSTIRLYGDGFRNKGEISINGIQIEEGPGNKILMVSTGMYEIKLTKSTVREIAEASGDPAYTRRDNIHWKIKYKQHTKQGYEYAPIFAYTRPIVSDYDIVSFVRNATTGVANLVLKISVPDQSNAPGATIDGSVGNVDSIRSAGGGYYHVIITLNKGRDSFTLTITRDDGSERTFDDIGVPDIPTIVKVANMGTGKEEGPSDQEHDVQITGKNLKRVVQVMFNTTEGKLIQGDSDSVLIVKTPKMDGPTRVLLRTDLTLNGRPVTNIDDLGTQNKAKYVFKKPDPKAGS